MGHVEIQRGVKMKTVTTLDMIKDMEKKVKTIIVQKNEYDRCCFPEKEIPKISEKMIPTVSPTMSIEAIKKIVKKGQR